MSVYQDVWTEERKQQQSKLMKEVWATQPERYEAFVNSVKGKPKSDETKSKMSAASKGKAKSAAHCEAMAAAHTKRYKEIHNIQSTQNCTYKEALQIYKAQ